MWRSHLLRNDTAYPRPGPSHTYPTFEPHLGVCDVTSLTPLVGSWKDPKKKIHTFCALRSQTDEDGVARSATDIIIFSEHCPLLAGSGHAARYLSTVFYLTGAKPSGQ